MLYIENQAANVSQAHSQGLSYSREPDAMLLVFFCQIVTNNLAKQVHQTQF